MVEVLEKIGYTGRDFDAESPFYYYRARYYNPGTGTFISEDPIGFKAGDNNLYRYVENNSIKYKDPTGKFLNIGIGAVIGAVFGAITAGEGNRIQGALIGAGAGALAGTGFGGVFLGSALGGISDAGIQLASGTSVNNLNLASIAFSSVAGGVGTFAGSLASKFIQIPGRVVGNALSKVA